MPSLKQSAPRPRNESRRPNYPAAWACGAMLLLAACGGTVEHSNPETDSAGAAGNSADTPMPMPSGAGAGGSYDPGTGGNTTGGTGGYDPGMPTGAGAGGSYEPEFDAGPAGVADAPYEPYPQDSAVDADVPGLPSNPCAQACSKANPGGWLAFLDLLTPCLCAAESSCQSSCEHAVCAAPDAVMTTACSDCALQQAANECAPVFAACFDEPVCMTLVQCMLACE